MKEEELQRYADIHNKFLISEITQKLDLVQQNMKHDVDTNKIKQTEEELVIANKYIENYNNKDRVVLHSLISNRNTLIYKYKNALYGNSIAATYNKLGDKAMLIRLLDKISRLTNLVMNETDDVESVEDNILDLNNYAIAWLIERRIHEKD